MQSLKQLLGMASRGSGIPLVRQTESPTAKRSRFRVEVLNAINGQVLEIAHRPNDHSDWEVELYIVQPDEALSDALATILVLKGKP